jgi:hypothetical protein
MWIFYVVEFDVVLCRSIDSVAHPVPCQQRAAPTYSFDNLIFSIISKRIPFRAQRDSSLLDRLKAEIVVICSNMSHSDQHGGSCPPQDMRDAANYQYPPPSEEGYEQTRPYYQLASSSDSSVILPSISYDAQFLQPGGYPQDSRVNPQDSRVNLQASYRDAQQQLPDHGRDEPGSWNGFHTSFTQSAPRQRAAIACRYCNVCPCVARRTL